MGSGGGPGGPGTPPKPPKLETGYPSEMPDSILPPTGGFGGDKFNPAIAGTFPGRSGLQRGYQQLLMGRKIGDPMDWGGDPPPPKPEPKPPPPTPPTTVKPTTEAPTTAAPTVGLRECSVVYIVCGIHVRACTCYKIGVLLYM